MFFVQTERIKSNDTEEQNEVGEHVHDEGRDQAHLDLHRKCEILSCCIGFTKCHFSEGPETFLDHSLKGSPSETQETVTVLISRRT